MIAILRGRESAFGNGYSFTAIVLGSMIATLLVPNRTMNGSPFELNTMPYVNDRGVGIVINFVGLDPINALFLSAVINGFVAVPVMAVMMVIARDHRVMGRYVLSRSLTTMGWIATAVMACAVATLGATALR